MMIGFEPISLDPTNQVCFDYTHIWEQPKQARGIEPLMMEPKSIALQRLAKPKNQRNLLLNKNIRNELGKLYMRYNL